MKLKQVQYIVRVFCIFEAITRSRSYYAISLARVALHEWKLRRKHKIAYGHKSHDAVMLDCSQSPIFPCDRRCGSWSLNANETGVSTKCPWVEVVEGTTGRKNIPIFSAPSPHAINITTPTQGHVVLSPVSLASRDRDGGPVKLNDMVSRKNRGLWTVYCYLLWRHRGQD